MVTQPILWQPDTELGGVSLAQILVAAERIQPYVHLTPLLSSRTLNQLAGVSVWSKAEHLQRTGSFKVRGAFNKLLSLSLEECERGVIAFSSGNHAQAVALAARTVGSTAVIVMPQDAPAGKIAATRDYGADIIFYDRQKEDREAVAARHQAQTGRVLVPPFDDPVVIAGQGTVGLELLAQQPDLSAMLVPVGGGGLISGIAVALKSVNPAIRLIGVEPELANDAQQSLQQGQVVRIPQPNTVADAVATQFVGALPFQLMQRLVDEIVTVSESEILAAKDFIATRMKQVVEPTGALTTAALLSGKVSALTPQDQVGSLFCGGNS